MTSASSVSFMHLSNNLAWLFPWQLWGHAALRVGPTTYEKHPLLQPASIHTKTYDEFMRMAEKPVLFGPKRKVAEFVLDLTPQESSLLTKILEQMKTKRNETKRKLARCIVF
jgi:hypothetical protein